MNVNQINAFLSIVETNSFTKAAEKLYVSQSTLSDRLSSLEEELGIRLIQRRSGNKHLSLTEKGIAFLDYAARYVELEKEIDDWKQEKVLPQVKIGAPQSVNTYLFRDFYRQYLDATYHLHVSAHWNRTIYTMINAFHLDIGIVSRPYQSKQVTTVPLLDEPLLIVYDDRFAQYQDMAELNRGDQIYIGWGPAYKEWYHRHWDTTMPARMTLDSPELLMDYLTAPHTWAIVPLCVYQDIAEKNNHIRTLPTKSAVYRRLYVIYQFGQGEARNKKIRNFITDMQTFIRELAAKEHCVLPNASIEAASQSLGSINRPQPT